MSRTRENATTSNIRRSPQRAPTLTRVPHNRIAAVNKRPNINNGNNSVGNQRQSRNAISEKTEVDGSTNNEQDRTVHVGSGYQMFTPSTTKREQMMKQAENEQRKYQEHVEKTRLHNIHEVHRLGGSGINENEARRRQIEKYQQEKYARLNKLHEDKLNMKREEQREIEAKKQAARQQSNELEKRSRDTSINPTRQSIDKDNRDNIHWTDTAREADRRETMDRFLNRFTQQNDNRNTPSNDNQLTDHYDTSNVEKLSLLHDMFPHLDNQTLEYHLEAYNGDIERMINELSI